jgi:hypothetical protein
LLKEIVITGIEPFDNGHKRRVYLLDTRSGMTHTMVYGDSVSEAHIRIVAPTVIGKKTNKRGEMNNERL